MVFFLYAISSVFYKPSTVDSFEHLHSPTRIEIKKEPESTASLLDNKLDLEVASISDSIEIETIMTDIRNTDLKCLSGVKYLDYYRNKPITKPRYRIYFNYINNFTDPHLYYIEFNNRNEAVAYVVTFRDVTTYNPFVNYAKPRYYPIHLSPESLKILNVYLRTYQTTASNGESQ